MKPIMSIDYGEVRIGIAISDELGIVAKPLKVIKNKKNVEYEILEIVKKYNVGKVIIGVPYWEHPTSIVDKIKNFIEKLRKIINVDIELVNEFYSTKIAQQKLASLGKKLKKYKKNIDSYAACVILQDYLDSITTK
ncbi:MAG: Holliday junction resolvase RuvX [Elusimicrobiota bacterium]|nr:Holliday junction resolvase RuvX [Endomicrobiia bacterium]MDW8165728.1 Holliday junction resolvase RuvX [Elusimicrobiota bacterium]